MVKGYVSEEEPILVKWNGNVREKPGEPKVEEPAEAVAAVALGAADPEGVVLEVPAAAAVALAVADPYQRQGAAVVEEQGEVRRRQNPDRNRRHPEDLINVQHTRRQP